MTRQVVEDAGSKLIQNLVKDPLGANATTKWSTYGGSSGSGTPVTLSSQTSVLAGTEARVTVTGTTATQANVELSWVPSGGALTPSPSGVLSTVVWLKASSARAGGNIRFRGSDSVDHIYNLPTQVGTQWAKVAVTMTGLNPAATYTVTYKENGSAAVAQNEFVAGTRAMVVRGVYSDDYCGPDTPGWKTLADGTSVGYPYTLSSALGGLPYWYLPHGNMSVTPPDPGAFADRSMIAVYYADGTASGNYTTALTYGHQSTGWWIVQMGPTGNLEVGARTDTGASGTAGFNQNVYGVANTGRGLGNHIVSGRISAGVTAEKFRVDGSATVESKVLNAGVGFSAGPLALASPVPSADITPLAAVYVPTNLSDATELAVIKWLANHYGVPLIA